MIEVKRELLTGVPAIDKQHLELINRVNTLLNTWEEESAEYEEIHKLLVFLGDYVVKHFHDEEELQKEYNYPNYVEHSNQHKAFLESYKTLLVKYKNIGPTKVFMQHIKQSVVGWVINHIQQADLQMAKYIRAHS